MSEDHFESTPRLAEIGKDSFRPVQVELEGFEAGEGERLVMPPEELVSVLKV